MRKGIWVFLAVVQAILLAAHFLVYETWEYFWSPASRAVKSGPAVVVVLAISFVTASLLSFKYWNSVTRTFYRAAAIWLGLFNFLFLAAVGTWLTALLAVVLRMHWNHRAMIGSWFVAAVATATWGMINASVTRIRRVKVSLPKLCGPGRAGKSAARIECASGKFLCGWKP